jgi:iron complex outermembrane receptor protein
MDARVRHTIASILLLGPLLPVAAQEQPATTNAEQLQTVVVTGTLIKRADFDTPSPLQVITADDLKNSGYTSISDVLRSLSANGQGTLTQTNPFSFAGGASGVALRGLTVGATLTLVDGERMVAYPLTDDGQRTFVDTSSIPFSVVERVEVLKDGASSEYGSDAIAGVVNVIIKKSFKGFEFNAEAGQTGDKDGATEHINGIAGIGDLDSDGYNAYFSLEWRHQDPIYLFNRSGLWNETNWTPWGGVNLTPGAGSAYAAGAVFYPGSLTGILLNPVSQALDGSEVYLHNACTDAKMFADQCTYEESRLQIQPQTGNLNLLGRWAASPRILLATGRRSSPPRCSAAKPSRWVHTFRSILRPHPTSPSAPVYRRRWSMRACFPSRYRPTTRATLSARRRHCFTTFLRSDQLRHST